MPSRANFPERLQCLHMRTCTRHLMFSLEILCHIFVPAFRERRPRQVWIHPRRSLWLCQFWRDLPAEHYFFPSTRRLRSQPKRSCLGRCPEWTFWRFQCHEDTLTGQTSWPQRTPLVSQADSRQPAPSTIGECIQLCRLCRQQLSWASLRGSVAIGRVRFGSLGGG